MLRCYEFRGILLLLCGGSEEQNHASKRLAAGDPALVKAALHERRSGVPHRDTVVIIDLRGDAGCGIGLGLRLANVTDENDETDNRRNLNRPVLGSQGFSSIEVTKISITRMNARTHLHDTEGVMRWERNIDSTESPNLVGQPGTEGSTLQKGRCEARIV